MENVKFKNWCLECILKVLHNDLGKVLFQQEFQCSNANAKSLGFTLIAAWKWSTHCCFSQFH